MQGTRYAALRLLALGILSALGSLLVTWLMASYVLAWPVTPAGHLGVALTAALGMMGFTVLSGRGRRGNGR